MQGLSASLNTLKKGLKNNLFSVDEVDDLMRDLEFHHREDNPLYWGAYYFPHKFTKEFCDELHNYLIDIMYESETFTLAPRDHAKSTIVCFLIPIYLAYTRKGDFKHFLLVQETATKAKSTNLNIRDEIEKNELLRDDYGEQVGEKWTEKQFTMRNGTAFSCAGVGESLRGLNVNNNRPDFCVVDDIYELSDCENQDAVKKKVEYYEADLVPAMADSSLGQSVCIHNVGTAINQNDHIHKAEKWGHPFFRRFKAIDETANKSLWKPIEWLMERKKRLGSIIFAREFQNEIRDEASAIIKLADIKYYDGRKILTKREAIHEKKMLALDELPEYIVWNRGAVDPAEKEKEHNDFTARAAVAFTSFGNFYVYDIENEKVSFNKNKLNSISFAKRNNLDLLLIETNKGQALYDEIKRTTAINLTGKHEKQDKITRKIKQSAKFENGKVFISMLIPDIIRDELVDQLIINKPNHDDLSDAVINLLEMTDKKEVAFF